MAESDVKPADQQIAIIVKDANDKTTTFRVKRKTPFAKIIDTYAAKMGIDSKAFQLMHDGEEIKPTDTPDTLDLEDGAVVNAMARQVGGSGSRA